MNDQDAEILALLGQMNQWWENNPFQIVQIETVGRYIDLSGFMYYFVDDQNRRRYVGDVTVKAPFPAHYRFTVVDGTGYYQFPDSGSYTSDGAVAAYESILQSTIGTLSQTNVMLNASKLRELRTVEGRNELFVRLDSWKMGLVPADVDIDHVMEYDATPRISRVRQLRLGLAQISTYRYLSQNRAEVLAAIPALPPFDQARKDLTFDAALKKDILYFRMLKSQGA